MTLHLLSCASTKLDHAARAEDMYISPWFLKTRTHVLRTGSPWRIVSAKHGLLEPAEMIEPYEATLNTITIRDRRAWAGVGRVGRLPDAQR